jgi:hypothetical protein
MVWTDLKFCRQSAKDDGDQTNQTLRLFARTHSTFDAEFVEMRAVASTTPLSLQLRQHYARLLTNLSLKSSDGWQQQHGRVPDAEYIVWRHGIPDQTKDQSDVA